MSMSMPRMSLPKEIKDKAIPTLSAKECGYKLLLVRVGTPGRKERSLIFDFRRFDHIGRQEHMERLI